MVVLRTPWLRINNWEKKVLIICFHELLTLHQHIVILRYSIYETAHHPHGTAHVTRAAAGSD